MEEANDMKTGSKPNSTMDLLKQLGAYRKNLKGNSLWWAIIVILILIIFMPGIGSVVGRNHSGYYTINQTFYFGDLVTYMNPGMYWRFWGVPTKYKYSDIIYFSKHSEEGGKRDESIFVRFNDGGTAFVTVNVRYILSPSPEKGTLIHRHFRGHNNLINTCLRPLVEESVILSAAMMSSEESYTTKRSLFSQLARDQISHGIYLTEQEETRVTDPVTGEDTISYAVVIKRDPKTKLPMRKENPIEKYGIQMSQFVIKEIDYEKDVVVQIKVKRQALQATIKAKAEAIKAVEQRKTAEEVGLKNVSVSKYGALETKEQAIVDAKRQLEVAVKEAEQRRNVAKLQAQQAEKELEAATLRAKAEYEVARKRLAADGAVKLKGEYYLKIVEAWTDAFQSASQGLVPEIGGSSSTNGITIAYSIMQEIVKKLSKEFGVTLIPKAGRSGQ
jgi:hypothetical protein